MLILWSRSPSLFTTAVAITWIQGRLIEGFAGCGRRRWGRLVLLLTGFSCCFCCCLCSWWGSCATATGLRIFYWGLICREKLGFRGNCCASGRASWHCTRFPLSFLLGILAFLCSFRGCVRLAPANTAFWRSNPVCCYWWDCRLRSAHAHPALPWFCRTILGWSRFGWDPRCSENLGCWTETDIYREYFWVCE